MKKFRDFKINEADIRDIYGLPKDFISITDREAREMGINIDSHGQFQRFYSELVQLNRKALGIMTDMGSLPKSEFEIKLDKLEDLAVEVIREEFGDVLDSFEVPVTLDLNIVREGESVYRKMGGLGDIPSDYYIGENVITENLKEDFLMGVSKKKILNMITQGEGKATKKIIAYSETVRKGLSEIFSPSKADELIPIWVKVADLAHKMDWTMDVKQKVKMMKHSPIGIAGATEVLWENKINENTDLNNVTVRAYAIDFLMLIHEGVKGVYRLFSSLAIKKDKEFAEKIKKATTSFFDEAQDFRYGSSAQKMFNIFVMNCKDADKYKIIKPMVFTKLALDVERGGEFSDEKFLQITKSLFSCFKIIDGEIKLDKERFSMSKSRIIIEKMIKNIIKDEEIYREELERWEREQRREEFVEPSEIDIEGELGVELERDLSDLSKSEIQQLIDNALDSGNYEEVERLSEYL